jgi:diketogulonate reductase-like aldo/keto reductase
MITTPSNEHFYGTAWKEENTTSLVYDAIRAGYRAIDTAS